MDGVAPFFSPDGRRVAMIVGKGSRQAVFVDGHAGPEFLRILETNGEEVRPSDTGSVLFSADSLSFAYVAETADGGQVVVIDGKPGPVYTAIEGLAYAPTGHQVAYIGYKSKFNEDDPGAYEGQKIARERCVVVNGQPGPAFHAIENLLFSADGKRVAYVGINPVRSDDPFPSIIARDNYVVVDGQPQRGYGLVKGLTFSPDGSRIAYIAQARFSGRPKPGARPLPFHMVIDGKRGPAFDTIYTFKPKDHAASTILFSDDGRHYVYVAGTDTDWDSKSPKQPQSQVLVFDDEVVAKEEIGAYGPREPMIIPSISPDGARWAYVATPDRQESTVVVDEERQGPYRAATQVLFSPDSQHYAFIAATPNGDVVVHDGQESQAYPQHVEELMFSPDSRRLAYVAGVAQGQKAVVINGEPGPTYRYIEPDSLKFSEDGKSFNYLATEQHASYGLDLVVDHKSKGREAVLSPDGSRVASIQESGHGRSSQKSALYVDGKPTAEGFHSNVTFSPDGKRYAAIGLRSVTNGDKGYSVVIDGAEVPEKTLEISDLKFSPDSSHAAWVARNWREKDRQKTRVEQIYVDGLPLATFGQIVSVSRRDPDAGYPINLRKISFLDNGALEFFPVKDQKLYRARILPTTLASLPALETSTANLPGLHPVKEFTAYSDEGGNPGNLVLAPDGSLFGTSSLGGDYLKGFIFRIGPDGAYQPIHSFLGNQQDGSEPSSLVMGADGQLYGTLSKGGQNNAGSLFRINTEGSGFTVLHHIDPENDGNHPVVLSAGADGVVTAVSLADSSYPGRLWRISPGASSASLLHKGVSPSKRAYTLKAEEEQANYNLQMLRSQLKNAQQKKDTPRIQSLQRQIGQTEADVAALKAKANQPLGDMGALVDGQDGYYYGVTSFAEQQPNKQWRSGIFKLSHDGSQYSIIHVFQGPPTDGQRVSQAPVLGQDAMLYGVTDDGGISGEGVIYRIGRDGSGYTVLYNPREKLSPGKLLAHHNGMLYGVAIVEPGRTNTPEFYRLSTDGAAFTVVDTFKDKAFARATLLPDGDRYVGLLTTGNGGGKIFSYLPPSGNDSAAAGAIALAEVMHQPEPLLLPQDSFEPVAALFGDPELPKPVIASVASPDDEETADPLAAQQPVLAQKPAPEAPGESSEPEILEKVEKITEKSEEAKSALEKAKKVFKLPW